MVKPKSVSDRLSEVEQSLSALKSDVQEVILILSQKNAILEHAFNVMEIKNDCLIEALISVSSLNRDEVLKMAEEVRLKRVEEAQDKGVDSVE
jgi:hypothetical protein